MTDTVLREGDLVLFYPRTIDRSKQLIGTYHGPCSLTANEHHHVKADLNEPHRHIPLCDIRKLPPLKIGEPVWCPVTIGGKHVEGFFGRIDSYESEQDLHSASAESTVAVLHPAHGTIWRCPHRVLYIPGTQPPAQPAPIKRPSLGEFIKEHLPLEIELTPHQQEVILRALEHHVFRQVSIPLRSVEGATVEAIGLKPEDLKKVAEAASGPSLGDLHNELLELRRFKQEALEGDEIDEPNLERVRQQLDKSPAKHSYYGKPLSESAALELERLNKQVSQCKESVNGLGQEHLTLAQTTDRLEAKVKRLQARLTAIYHFATEHGKREGTLEQWIRKHWEASRNLDDITADRDRLKRFHSNVFTAAAKRTMRSWSEGIGIALDRMAQEGFLRDEIKHGPISSGGWPIDKKTYDTLDAIAKGGPTSIPQGMKPRRFVARRSSGEIIYQKVLDGSPPAYSVKQDGTLHYYDGRTRGIVQPGGWSISVEP